MDTLFECDGSLSLIVITGYGMIGFKEQSFAISSM